MLVSVCRGGGAWCRGLWRWPRCVSWGKYLPSLGLNQMGMTTAPPHRAVKDSTSQSLMARVTGWRSGCTQYAEGLAKGTRWEIGPAVTAAHSFVRYLLSVYSVASTVPGAGHPSVLASRLHAALAAQEPALPDRANSRHKNPESPTQPFRWVKPKKKLTSQL